MGVLSDEQRRAAYGLHNDEPNGLSDRLARVERAVIASLAARGGAIHDTITTIAIDLDIKLADDLGDNVPYIIDALRLALAQQEARHAVERDALRAQLAAAQRVPEDAELDELDYRLKQSNFVVTWDASQAITALRRRVAELEAGPHDTINLLSDVCECGHRRSYHRGWHNTSSRLGCIGGDCGCEKFNEIEEPQDAE